MNTKIYFGSMVVIIVGPLYFMHTNNNRPVSSKEYVRQVSCVSNAGFPTSKDKIAKCEKLAKELAEAGQLP